VTAGDDCRIADSHRSPFSANSQPMWTDQYRALARYNTWINHRLYACVATLDDQQRKQDFGAYFRSIEGTLNHILLADRIWMARFTGDEGSFTSRDRFGVPIAFEGLSQILYPVFAELYLFQDHGRTVFRTALAGRYPLLQSSDAPPRSSHDLALATGQRHRSNRLHRIRADRRANSRPLSGLACGGR
jgi:hypothetical protein